jgi:hypothetical protein
MQEQRHEQSQRCDPVQGARPVFVDVYAHNDKNGDVKFCHDWRLQANGPSQGDGAIEVPRGTKRSPIHFQLHDDTGRQLKFFQDARESIWARVGKCPEAEGNGGQIDFAQAQSGGQTLRVDNDNSAQCELHYALRFKDKNDKIWVYDPIISNKGGGP